MDAHRPAMAWVKVPTRTAAFVSALLILCLTLFSSSNVFAQATPVADYFDYPMGDRGYDLATSAVDTIWEYINPETNNLYSIDTLLDSIIATPQRGPYILVNGKWYNASDAGDHATNGIRGGIHPGSDWNLYIDGVLKPTRGQNIYAIANGIVDTIRKAGKEVTVDSSGWAIILKHYLPDGDSVYSFYVHTTTASADSLGTVCLNISDFTISIGDTVTRGQLIAKVGNVKSYTPHLHFEMRLYFNKTGLLWPHGTGGRYPANNAMYAVSMTEAQVEYAYDRMRLDSIIDGDDFIDAHRPTAFAVDTILTCGGPVIAAQNTIGGSTAEFFGAFSKTSDNGFIVGGGSTSDISGDKTENNFDPALTNSQDYWIVKLNSNLEVVWDKTIGGTGDDFISDIHQTSDGGYIIGGSSTSGVTGNKSKFGFGNYDYWIVKLDADHNIEWQQDYGGSENDFLESITQTADGGYIVGGTSSSGVTGIKNEASYGGEDYWVLKLDAVGVIQWQKTIGGSSPESFTKIIQTTDGGYLAGGYSTSDISGVKTESAKGGADYWIVKLNSTGTTILWQETLGGSAGDLVDDLVLTSDNGFIVAGHSSSNVSVDKTQPSKGFNDYWIVKFNSSYIKEWDKTYGGGDQDLYPRIVQQSDGNYYVSGSSNSSISGDKCEASIGIYDIWTLQLNSSGDIIWQGVTGGSNSEDQRQGLLETNDNGVLLGVRSSSPISGDKNEGHVGENDYWVVKLGGTGCTPTAEICNSIDDDCDGIVDDGISVSVSITASGATTFCQGSSVNLVATHTGTTLQWYKNAVAIAGATSATYTANATGSYTCMTANACAFATSTPIAVTANKNPNASISAAGSTTFCAGGSVTLNVVPVGGSTYQWYKGASPLAGATGTSYVATTAGNYKCRVTKTATGCFKNSNTIVVSVTCREGEIAETSVKIFPNPTSGLLTIDIDDATSISVVVSNMLGQIVAEQTATDDCTIDLGGLPRGSYAVTVVSSTSVHSEIIVLE